MQSSANQGAPILVGAFGNVVWIRIEGKGSFQNSPDLKEFAARMIERDQANIVIDLKNCPVMDSTFMGTLTGISLRLRKHPSSGRLQVINANDRNKQLLQSLGLDQIFDLDTEGAAWRMERELVEDNLLNPAPHSEMDKQQKAEFVLEAHEVLCKANDENVRRFKDVIEFLKHDLDEKKRT